MEEEDLDKVYGKKGARMPQGRERGLSSVCLVSNQTIGNCRWKARPGRGGQVASSRVLDQVMWDVREARLSSPGPPDPMLPPFSP